jgi:hypothetical protein
VQSERGILIREHFLRLSWSAFLLKHTCSCSKLVEGKPLLLVSKTVPFCAAAPGSCRPRLRDWAASCSPQACARFRSTSRDATASSSTRLLTPLARWMRHALVVNPSCTATYTWPSTHKHASVCGRSRQITKGAADMFLTIAEASTYCTAHCELLNSCAAC